RYRDRVTRFVLIDEPLPGVWPWEEVLKNPLLWHFRFGGPDMERLVAGRERIYLDRFWNEFSGSPARFSEGARRHYAALYALPGAMHSGFAQFAAFDQDAIDNRAFLAQGRLKMPILALGGEKSFGATMATVMRAAGDYVDDVASLVRLVRSAEKGLPVFLLGHSAGGVVACLYAVEHQAELAGLICESFAFRVPAPDFALAVLKGLSHVAPHAHVLRLKNEDFSRDPQIVAAMNNDPLIAHETQPTKTVAELVRSDERLKEEFAR